MCNFVMCVVLLVLFSCSIEVVVERVYFPDWICIFPGLLVNFIKLYGMSFHKNFFAFAETNALNMMAQKE